MPIYTINGNIRTNTAAGWAADATVYSAKTILVTTDATYGVTDQRKFKIADGTQTWSNLDYFPVSGYDDATSSIQTQIDSKKITTLQFQSASFSPADSTTYRITPIISSTAVSTGTATRVRVKLNNAVSAFTLYLTYNLNAAGSNEGTQLTVRNHTQSTEANFTTSLDLSVTSAALVYTATLSCSANDEIELLLVTPVYATNPTAFLATFFLSF